MKKTIYLLLIVSATSSLPMLMQPGSDAMPSENTKLMTPTPSNHADDDVSLWCLPKNKNIKKQCVGCWSGTKKSCTQCCTQEKKDKLDKCCDAYYKCVCVCCLYTDDSILGRACPDITPHEREQRVGSCVGGGCCVNMLWMAWMLS